MASRMRPTRLMCPEKVDRLSWRFWLSPTSARILSNHAMAGVSGSPARYQSTQPSLWDHNATHPKLLETHVRG